MSVTAEQATIIVALIAMVGGVLTVDRSAPISRQNRGSLRENRRARRGRRLGDRPPYTLVAGQAGQDRRLATMEHRQNSTEADVSTSKAKCAHSPARWVAWRTGSTTTSGTTTHREAR